MLSMCDYIAHVYYSFWNRRVVVSPMCDYIVHVYYSLWNKRAVVLSMCDYIVHFFTVHRTGKWQCYPCVTILHMYITVFGTGEW